MKCAVTPLQDTAQSLFSYGYLTTEPPLYLREVVQGVCSIYQSLSSCLPPQTVSLCVSDSSWTPFSKMKKNVCLLLLQKLVTFKSEWKEARKGKNSYTEKCNVKNFLVGRFVLIYFKLTLALQVALHCLIFSHTESPCQYPDTWLQKLNWHFSLWALSVNNDKKKTDCSMNEQIPSLLNYPHTLPASRQTVDACYFLPRFISII